MYPVGDAARHPASIITPSLHPIQYISRLNSQIKNTLQTTIQGGYYYLEDRTSDPKTQAICPKEKETSIYGWKSETGTNTYPYRQGEPQKT